MTKCFLILFLLLLVLAHPANAHSQHLKTKAAAAPKLTPGVLQEHSHYAVLVDAVSGKVLWARNADTKRSIASTTKIMTAILLLERGHLDDVVTAPNGINKIEESSLHLSPGEKITLHDLLYAMLLRSANDTAVAGADYLSGSLPAFAAQMNAKAKEIGAANTHFVTPNGLYAKGHYSTAADLAKIAAYAVNTIPEFNEIVKTPKYKITRSMHKGDVWVKNTATTFLNTFPGADGIKTGYIHQAGHCFVGSATRGGWRLIAVALDSNSCREDVMSLLDYGFVRYVPTVAVAKEASVGTIALPSAAGPVPVKAAADIRAVVARGKLLPGFQIQVMPLSPPPVAPFAAGTKVGTILVVAGGKTQATGSAVAASDVPLKPSLALGAAARSIGARTRPHGIIVAAATLFVLGIIFYVRATAKDARRRRDRLAARLRRVDHAG